MRNRKASSAPRSLLSVLAVGIVILGGCSVGPAYIPPSSDISKSFYRGDQEDFVDRSQEGVWWRELEDPIVSELVDDALIENHDIRIARANIAAARARLRQSELDAFARVTARASTRTIQNSTAAMPGAKRTTEIYDAGFDASWELDFFGRVAASRAASAAEYEAAIFDRQAVAVIVAAEVVRNYLELRGAQNELDVLRRNAENQQQTYELAQILASAGRGSELDVARAGAQLQTTRAGIPTLKEDVARAIHRLGVLTGREPAALDDMLVETAPVPPIPGTIAIGEPHDLLRRRADVRYAERRLAAATERIGVATADLFPRVDIMGSAGVTARSIGALSNDRNTRTAFGPFLSWAAFDLGTVRAQIRAAEAESSRLLMEYEQTVLEVLEETENSLVQFAQTTSRHAYLREAARMSDNAANLAQIRYRAGADSFLDVLVAERQLLEVQRKSAQAETDRALAFVSLYKALGGGWEYLERLSPVL